VKIAIGNVKNGDEGEYVGRGTRSRAASPLGNPFVLRREKDRSRVVGEYRTWLRTILDAPPSPKQPAIRAEIERLRALATRPEGVMLLCHCAPLPCHAEVIRDVLLANESGGA
jgi:uncharacterized protein DUF4326